MFVVDDDVSVGESLELLIRFAGWAPEGIDTGTLASFGPAAMMANDNDFIRSSPIPA